MQGPPDVHLKIDGTKMGTLSDIYYHVALDDGRTGYALATLVLGHATGMVQKSASAEVSHALV